MIDHLPFWASLLRHEKMPEDVLRIGLTSSSRCDLDAALHEESYIGAVGSPCLDHRRGSGSSLRQLRRQGGPNFNRIVHSHAVDTVETGTPASRNKLFLDIHGCSCARRPSDPGDWLSTSRLDFLRLLSGWVQVNDASARCGIPCKSLCSQVAWARGFAHGRGPPPNRPFPCSIEP